MRSSIVLAALAVPALLASFAEAAGVVGDGNPGSCDESGLDQALVGAGTVTFACGGGTVVIPITTTKTLTATTTIDGSGQQIVLDGQNAVRLFETTYQFSSFTVTLRNLTLTNARAPNFGGAIRLNYQDFLTTLNIENVTFSNNTCTQAGPDVGGGALHAVSGFVNISNSVFTGNSGGNGGAIGQIQARLNIQDSIFSNNFTHPTSGGQGGNGGAIYVDGTNNGTMLIQRTQFLGNASSNLGGAIHTYQYAGASGVEIDDSYFDSNTTQNNGGAIYHQNGTLAISGSTFSHNVTIGQGGALWLLQASVTSITNSTFEGNDAVGQPQNNGSTGLGGAILINGESNVTISHSTIANNHADWVGGGICGGMGSSVTTLRGSIVAGNHADNGGNPWNIAHNCSTELMDGGYNLQFPNHANPSDPNDPNCTAGIAIGDPLLGPLQQNGGLTPTLALGPGSPARDAVASGCPPPAVDQRGMPRPAGPACDVGAYEAAVAADLSLTKTGSVDPAFTGGPLSYTLAVSNAGPAPADGLVVTDTLPPGLAFVSASAGCTNAAGTITCVLGSLAPGLSVDATINLTVTQLTGTITNSASVSSTTPDPDPTNNSASETTEVSPADLALTISESSNPVPPGGAFSYVLSVSNNGPAGATNVTLTNTLSPAVTFVSASTGCTQSAGSVICAVATLASGGLVVWTVDVTANVNWAGAVDTASVSADQTDPLPGNNEVSESTLFHLGLSQELVHGSVESLNLAALPGPLPREELFRIERPAHTSWEVVVDATSADIAGPAGALDLQLIGPQLDTVVLDSVGIGVGHSRSLRFVNDEDHELTDQLVRVRSTGCTTDCGPEAVYRIRAWETTYDVARFNNSGSQVTVVLLANKDDVAKSGSIWFWNPSGALLAQQAFDLGPHGTFVLNTSAIAASSSGSLTVSHDGPYGSLTGKAVSVEPATGFTFDTPLLPRPR